MSKTQRYSEIIAFAGADYAVQAIDAECNAEMLADVPVWKIEEAAKNVQRSFPEGGYAFSGDDIVINWGWENDSE